MQTLKYEVRFLTPAFLGNAEQSGQWRTPPFKALLRQWWRVVWAEKHGFREDLEAMRRDEGLLFGNAWLKRNADGRKVADYCKSQVRMRLSNWTAGSETKEKWGSQEIQPSGWKVRHPEVRQPIGPLLYLGYGPLEVSKQQRSRRPEYATKLKQNAAVQTGEAATLSVAVPDVDAADIRYALALIDAYGAVGGRSRNGWGSLSLLPANGSPAHVRQLAPWSRSWQEALKLDWPHAIGRDDKGALAWQTAKVYDDWKPLMRDLAIVKIGLRTMFVFPRNIRPPHQQPAERHWLSYPVTRHRTSKWKGNARLPNSLRLRVRPDAQDPRMLRGVIFHVPCLPPEDFRPQRAAIEKVWTRSHRLLDELGHQPDLRNYNMISDATRRDGLRQQLDTITMERIPQ